MLKNKYPNAIEYLETKMPRETWVVIDAYNKEQSFNATMSEEWILGESNESKLEKNLAEIERLIQEEDVEKTNEFIYSLMKEYLGNFTREILEDEIFSEKVKESLHQLRQGIPITKFSLN